MRGLLGYAYAVFGEPEVEKVIAELKALWPFTRRPGPGSGIFRPGG